ncbi:bifunctional hydroxymethylpyrimidine kinase/phosphomethylpyrimidine kinase [Variovorax sp. PCZ-1]|uniref:bifunctional hydroxymethylpyrimidine kinase/phosphomethylpyrimidine kinase n=1 Tax=Variovorax sp. PCZ-1 TaxID=2835533 RepID=UPI001BCAA7CD|nr:bifunctional hydroxymethylpyrimidine kinase/phosphomethylpyrimidine kinase [Variovorax sp. PCZ-1]MBS7808060.1 bifunctional hydroxymethylpyrimidine kinase/phosphomethylpyrimidine kinase [Variovorax sp. PCZ-1]
MSSPPLSDLSPPDVEEGDDSPICVMSFNVADASGAGGLSADQIAITASGGHALPVTTGILVRDTSTVFDLIELDADAVEEQARTILEDMDVEVFKVGFVGSPESLAVVAEITADYEEIPVITQVTPLSWWERDKIEAYLDALTELILPQTSVLVGNYDVLWRWLLPEWSSEKRPGARDIAAAAAQHGVPYVVITSANVQVESTETIAASPESVVTTVSLDRYEANFVGAGDTFSATLATLLASGDELAEAVREASIYVNRSLLAAFQPGMGAAIPDRMFWAQVEGEDEEDVEGEPEQDVLGIPPTATRH